MSDGYYMIRKEFVFELSVLTLLMVDGPTVA